MVYVITIDGIIGSGKSSLIAQLSNDFTCFQEPVHEWSLLQNFYEDMTTYSAPFQYQVLFSYHKLYSTFKNVKDKIILERCPWSSRHIFTEMLVESDYISQDEYNLYIKFFDKIAFQTDMYIYLKVDTDVAYNRILQRDRAAERSLKFEYLQQLNDKYNDKINRDNQNVYIVDANQTLQHVKRDVLDILNKL